MSDARAAVLFVDDEPRILSALRRSLRRERYEVLTAESSARALALLAQRRVDLIVSDQKMRGASGLDLLQEVVRRHPSIGRILLTGWPEEIPAEQLRKLGVRALVPKPWDDAALKDVIRAHLPAVPLAPRHG
jgi:response regulator RpfG family c-di-GMP phosphodiesterase